MVVRLAAAELAERQHDGLADVAFAIGEALPKLFRLIGRARATAGGTSGCARTAGGGEVAAGRFHFAGNEDRRLAEFLDELGVLASGDLLEASLGDVGQRCVRGADVVFAEHVAHADAKMLGVFEAVQDRVEVFGPAAQLGQRFFEDRQRRQVLDEQAVHQLVDHARVAGQDARQIRAGGAEPDVQVRATGG